MWCFKRGSGLWAFAGAVWIALYAAVGDARAAAGFSIEIGPQVVYCAAQWNGDHTSLRRSLEAGIEVSMVWRISVARVRNYWLNDEIADIEFSRHVRADLLARTWLLEDSASGITRTTSSPDEAMAFLTRIQHYPVLDRALLSDGELYVLTVAIERQDGAMGEAWWSRFWKQTTLQMQQEFSIP